MNNAAGAATLAEGGRGTWNQCNTTVVTRTLEANLDKGTTDVELCFPTLFWKLLVPSKAPHFTMIHQKRTNSETEQKLSRMYVPRVSAVVLDGITDATVVDELGAEIRLLEQRKGQQAASTHRSLTNYIKFIKVIKLHQTGTSGCGMENRLAILT